MPDETQDQTSYNSRAIKDLSADDRPREKALKHGIGSLTRAELLAILIGSGTPGESVIDLSQRILRSCDNKLSTLGKRTIGDLKRSFKGVGDAKAITILAAIELGRQYASEKGSSDQIQIRNSESAYTIMCHKIGHLNHEEFWFVALNTAKRVIGEYKISQGGLAATVVDSKLIMKQALDAYASCIILYHNHPSGNAKPSAADDAITEKIKKAGSYLEIPVIDHIIVCEDGYYSYADEGRL
ncbi:MAG: DNA repair protein RadC [Muribaculaceae bacterium]|nr:DNA repair protein RadC [Muribaculaceae bacterium]